MKIKYTLKDIKKTKKRPVTAIAVFIIDPLAYRITWLIANFSRITPAQVTIFGFSLGLIAAFLFLRGFFVLGAIFFELYYLLDCVDGKLARLKNQTSTAGDMLDHFLETILFFILHLTLLCYLHMRCVPTSYYFFIICFVFLQPFNRYIQHYSKHKFRRVYGKSILCANNIGENRISKVKSMLSKKGVYLNISNTEAIHFAFFIGPLFLSIAPTYYLCFGIVPANVAVVISIALIIYRDLALMKIEKANAD